MNSSTYKIRPFVSVVVPCFNGRETVGECLVSLSAQSYPKDRYEVIVTDNGSVDETCNYIQTSFPWVHLIHTTEKGSGYARNAGIREAKGELILSTDSDCIVDENWINVLVTTFEQASPDVAAIGGRIAPFSTTTEVEKYRPAWVSQPDALSNGNGDGPRYAATPNAAFRASALKRVGAFDGLLGFDDTDLGIRLGLAGYRIEYAPDAIVRHRNPVTLSELYRHRVKYGKFNFTLARKHPTILGDPLISGARRKLLLVTIRRIGIDVLVKLPIAIAVRPKDRPRIWPVIDATMAAANYSGFSQAVIASRQAVASS